MARSKKKKALIRADYRRAATISMRQGELDQLDKQASKHDMDRSEYVRWLVENDAEVVVIQGPQEIEARPKCE